MSLPILYDEFLKRLNEATDSIIPASEYLGWNKPMKYRCLKCGHEWVVCEARTIYKGTRCPKCSKKIQIQKLAKSRRKSEEQFRKELFEKQPNLTPNDVYVNVHTKYHCICKIHNCDVYTTPEKMLYRGQGCDLCAIERNKCAIRYTDKTFKEKALSLNQNIIFMSDYINIKSRIKVKCKICGHEWNPIAETLIIDKGYGCPKCARNAILTPDEFERNLKVTHPELKLLSPYIRSNKKVHVLCTDCNKDFFATPNKLQQGQHCPHCKMSNGERKIKQFLDNNNIIYEFQKKYDGLLGVGFRKLSYDFYIPSCNLLIEMQGEHHDKPVDYSYSGDIDGANERYERQKIHDKRKREYAEKNGIQLLEIWYWEVDNIDNILSVKLISKVA